MLPNTIQEATLRSLMGHPPQDLTRNILDEVFSSVGVRADRMYDYAKKFYTHGLPSGSIHAAVQGRAEAQAILDSLEGFPVELNYYQYGAPNALHIGWVKLLTEHGWNPASNEIPYLSAQKGKTVYLEDMVVVVPSIADMNPESLTQWGRPAKAGFRPGRDYADRLQTNMVHTPVYEDAQASEDYVLVTYCWEDIGEVVEGDTAYWKTILHTDTFRISLAGFDEQSDYAHARYSVNGTVKYWMYRIGSGTYPALDAVHDEEVTTGTFFPFAYFRYEKRSELEDTGSEAYKTSKRLVKYLGMDYDIVAEAIDENPDIADVEQAMLTLAVPASTEDPLERRYLFDFFNNWFIASGSQYSSSAQASLYETFVFRGNPDLTRNSIVIEDKRFRMALHNAGIFKQLKAGSIGEIGAHESGITEQEVEMAYVLYADENGTLTPPQERTRIVKVKTHYYRRQVTGATYEEIQVVGLKMLYHVFGDLIVTADEEDDILLIPIDRAITEYYKISDRETLYSRSLHFVFNSVMVVKLKWYQTGLFQFVMLAVAMYIAFASAGSGSGLVATLAAATTVTAVAMILLEAVLWGMLYAYAFRLFTELVGVEIALIIAMVAVLYGGAKAMNAGSLKGAPWAQELLMMGTGLAKSTQGVMADLLADAVSEFEQYVETKTELLEEGQKLLENNSLLSPFVIFGESPHDYYNRTIHSGNIGVLGLDAVGNYVEAALTLPKLHETIGSYD